MRNKYKNMIFNYLSNNSLGVENFEINETEENNVMTTLITYKNSPLKFTIRTSNESYDLFDYRFVTFSPKFDETSLFPPQNWTNFEVVFDAFKNWISSHVNEFIEESQIPDFWTEYNKGNKSLKFKEIDFNNRENFNIEEKEQIKMALNDLKLLIQTNLGTSKEEQELVVNRLDYLIETSNRLNKFDWKSVAVSTIVSISIALSLDTNKGQLLFDLFKKVFSVIPMLLP